MSHKTNELQPVLSHAEPVVAVQDVSATIKYWQNVLGFPAQWTWGDPPTHGGVSWHGVFVQFSQNPALAAVSKGHSIWIRVKHIKALYQFHQKNKADIVAPLENQPWGMAQYSVREINGYFLHFAAPVTERKKSLPRLPPTVKIVARKPTAREYRQLMASVGWGKDMDDAMAKERLAVVVFAVVAEDTESGDTIGCALLLGDQVSFYYVKDVMVHPDWQNRRVGTALMQELTHWLDSDAADKALVGLYTGENLAPFYQQFGFSKAFGMVRHVRHKTEGEAE